MIEQGLFSLLSSTSSITALVGNRISPVLLPTGSAYPALTYQIVGSSSEPTFSTSGFQRLRVEINCWSDRYLDAVTLRDTVTAALDGFQGVLSDGTYLQNVQSLQTIDFFESDSRSYRAMAEFYLFFNRQ